MTRHQRLALAMLCAVIALATLALAAAQLLYWGDGFAAFATLLGGGAACAFLKPD